MAAPSPSDVAGDDRAAKIKSLLATYYADDADGRAPGIIITPSTHMWHIWMTHVCVALVIHRTIPPMQDTPPNPQVTSMRHPLTWSALLTKTCMQYPSMIYRCAGEGVRKPCACVVGGGCMHGAC